VNSVADGQDRESQSDSCRTIKLRPIYRTRRYNRQDRRPDYRELETLQRYISLASDVTRADRIVVKSQEEALASGQVYDYCLLTTKCLPDIAPNHKLLAPALASKQIKSYALIQNGLDIEKDIYAALQANGQVEDVPIVTAAAWIGLMTSPDGKRIIWAGPRVCTRPLNSGIKLTSRAGDSLR
jgi:hypothetical protein